MHSALAQLAAQGITVHALTADSRRVTAGMAFAAYPGERLDGRSFIAEAVKRSAAAVLWERSEFQWREEWQVPNVGVSGLKQEVGPIAHEVYGAPSHHMTLCGVTGTNGKTSVSHWLAQCFSALGKRAAIVGTVGNGVVGALARASNTTPDAVELQKFLAEMAQSAVEIVAMEVSSHGLSQGRVNGTRFEVALFTNLSRDHLDYHGDMATYAEAKFRLFQMPALKFSVVNLDDPIGREFATRLADSAVKLIGYGFGDVPPMSFPVLRGAAAKFDQKGIEFDVRSPWGQGKVHAPVLGRFNASNLLCVLGGLLACDQPFERALRALSAVTAVPGRMQQLGGDGLPLVLIDYAHSPDGLEKALRTARELVTPGSQLVCVFGCGGNRDRGKRPLMGEIASRLADRVLVTSDNPRSEEPAAIAAEIVAGMPKSPTTILDRTNAIETAIRACHAGDVVLIAGKGHEDYQEIAGRKLPFRDVDAAQRVLKTMPDSAQTSGGRPC